MNQIINAYGLAFSYLRKYPKFWLWFVLRVFTTVVIVLIPVFVGYIIVLLTNHYPPVTIFSWVGLLILLVLVNPIIDKITFVNGWNLGFRVAHDFRMDAVKKLRHVGLSFWQEHDRGNVMKIIDQAFENFIFISGGITHMFVPFFGKILGIIITTTFIDPFIGFLLLVDILFFISNIKIVLPKESEAGIRERKGQEVVYGRINEYLVNYKTVVYLNLFNKQEKEIAFHNEYAYKAYQDREKLSGWKWYFNNQTHALLVAITIFYSVIQVMQGHLQIGMLTTVVFFSLSIAESMGEGMWNISEGLRYANGMKRYKDTFSEVRDDEGESLSSQIVFDNISLKNVSLQQKERETLQDINIKITKGQKVAIVGFTGSGKTTLIDILLKVITAYSGDVYINEYNYKDLHVRDVAKFYSIVPQEVQLFQGSIRENITIDRECSEKDLQQVIHVASLDGLLKKLPKGVDSHISESAANVSGGERQRIGIARSLLQKHPVLILDEATASLDPKTEREVVTNIISAYPEMTILYITHKYSLLNVFDSIIVMNEGSIIEQGSFDALTKKGGLFQDLFKASQLQ